MILNSCAAGNDLQTENDVILLRHAVRLNANLLLVSSVGVRQHLGTAEIWLRPPIQVTRTPEYA
jgi:hypothetical protein